MKDLIGYFNQELQSHFFGANEMVPVPRHDITKEEWMAVARIIYCLWVEEIKNHSSF